LHSASDTQRTQLDAGLPASAWINRAFVKSSNGV
jgi:hypothetical protein